MNQYDHHSFSPSPEGQPVPDPTQSPKTRLSVGAWIGISVAALSLVTAVILAVTLTVVPSINLLLGALQNQGATPPIAGLPDGEELEKPPTEDDLSGAGDVVTLDDSADFMAGPFWAIPFQDGWEIEVLDVEGENRFSHPATGCAFYSYQGLGPAEALAATDREATELTVPTALQIGIPWNATAEPSVIADGSVELFANYAYPVEMMRLVANYSSPDGDRQRQMVMRTFMPANAALYFEIDCPISAEAAMIAEDVIGELGLTDF